MRVRLLTVSQRQPSWVISACAEYEKRMPRAWQFEVLEIKPEARTSGVTRQKVQAAESIRIKNAVPKGALVVALDERGESWTTERFAEKIEGWQQIGRDLAFVIGGADGLDGLKRRGAARRRKRARAPPVWQKMTAPVPTATRLLGQR